MSKENNSSIEKLFGSKTRAKLLRLFFETTDKSYYVREITRVIEEQINSVRRELANLESIGIIKNETFDNKIYYSANSKSEYFMALNELFNHGSLTLTPKITAKKVEKEDKGSVWKEYAEMVEGYLDGLIVFNRLPGEKGIDLFIVGDDKTKKLTGWAEMVEKKQGKPLNYVIMSDEDFAYRKSVRDRFLMDILEMPAEETIDPTGLIRTM